MPETVRVRAAVVVDENGDYVMVGNRRHGDTENEALAHEILDPATRWRTTWIEAEVPLPEKPETIEAVVAPERDGR